MEPPATQRRGSMPAPLRLSLSVASGNAREFELWHWDHAPLYAMVAPPLWQVVRQPESGDTCGTSVDVVFDSQQNLTQRWDHGLALSE